MNIIDYCIEQHKSLSLSPLHLRHLKSILIKYKDICPIWEFDIGTYKGQPTLSGERKLKDSEYLKLELKNPDKTYLCQNYAWMRDPNIQKELTRLISNWEKSKICVECDVSELKYINPLLLVNKNKNKTGDKREYRLCIDFKTLNINTHDRIHHIPIIMEELHRFRGMQCISKLDLRHAFHHIRIHPNSTAYTGFYHNGKYYKLLRMGFGFKNAIQTMQYCIERTLKYLTNTRAYIDDIYILSYNIDDGLTHLDKTLNKLLSDGWKLRLDKCEFLMGQVVQLGKKVDAVGIKTNDKHINKLLNFPKPTSTKMESTYIGLLNYLQPFLPDLHNIKSKLRISNKNDKFVWTDDKQKAFDESKYILNKFKNSLIYHPSPHLPYVIDIDASKEGFGCVIYQIGRNGAYPIEYYSSLFSPSQMPWHSTTKELYGVVRSLQRFRKYYFTRNDIIYVNTDCTYVLGALKHANTNKNNKFIRWSSYLSGMKLLLIHKPGSTNTMADWLSREYFGNDNFDKLDYNDKQKIKLQKMYDNLPNDFQKNIVNTTDDMLESDSMIRLSTIPKTEKPLNQKSMTEKVTKNGQYRFVEINYNINKIENYCFGINIEHPNIIPIKFNLPKTNTTFNKKEGESILITPKLNLQTKSDEPITKPDIPKINYSQSKNQTQQSTQQSTLKNIPKLENINNTPKVIYKEKIVYIHTPISDTLRDPPLLQYKQEKLNWSTVSHKCDTKTLDIKTKELEKVTVLDIRKAQKEDIHTNNVIKYLECKDEMKKEDIMDELTVFYSKNIENMRILNGLLYYIINDISDNPRLVLPKSIIRKVLLYQHNSIFGHHNGITKFKLNISSKFFFKNIDNYCSDIVNSCINC